MGPLDRLAYQALVESVSEAAIGDLSSWVYGWRLARKNPSKGKFAYNGTEWQDLQAHLFQLSSIATYGLQTDLTSFFGSIPIPRLIESLEMKATGGLVFERLTSLLQQWDDTPLRSGLPQRSTASAVLANMYLHPFDRILREHCQNIGPTPGGPPMASRWMDDVWALGFTESNLRSIQVQLIHAARDLGLELHMGKTAVLEGAELVRALGKLHMSGVDYALRGDAPDFTPLHAVLEEILANPFAADRSLVRFLTVRLRRGQQTDSIQRLIDVAPQMPHAADHLARAFRDAGLWKGLENWFLEYCNGPWAIFPWAQAQLATMFPSTLRPSQEFIEMLARWVEPGVPIDRMAVAIQRLSKWAPDTLADLLDANVASANHPFERRLLGLASASLGLGDSRIRAYLTSYPELSATAALVRTRGKASLAIVRDFDQGSRAHES